MGGLTWIIVGLIAGWLANKAVRRSSRGLLGNLILGVVGAFVGGWLAGTFFNIPDAITGFNLTTILIASLGAIAVLLVARALGN